VPRKRARTTARKTRRRTRRTRMAAGATIACD
jgi:hypothetical protein